MIEFYRIYDVDNELYEFCLRQKGYYQRSNYRSDACAQPFGSSA